LAIKNYLKPTKNSKDWNEKLLINFNEASKITNNFLTQSSTETELYQQKKVL